MIFFPQECYEEQHERKKIQLGFIEIYIILKLSINKSSYI